ncbi:hypothetical protein [uncultured Lutibacter sp.]|uniref:hypothetical protein n=1 Tax=uncultured Lutibacter sp. TaxID=437739 RepID=UPI00262CE214|nr:hypothetical protein [uncultured Lutibacter sp.]
MNKLGTILSAAIILLSFSFCSSTKDLTKVNHPFKVTKATYNTWVGGQPGVKGIKIVVTIDHQDIELDTVFFRSKKVPLKRDISTEFPIFVGVYSLPNTKKDYILHEDPVNEYGNTPINKSLNIPFSLKKDEAIVSYLLDNKTYYYKIDEVVEIKSTEKY